MRITGLIYSLLIFLFIQPVFAQSTYKLQPGDALEVWVAQYPDLTREVAVAPDGWISLPLAGTVQAEGMTLEALQSALVKKLQPFFKEEVGLNVSLVPSEVNRPSIFVAGSVERPGTYPFVTGMTVLHAVSVAGGLYRANLPVSEQARTRELEGLIATGEKRHVELGVMIARLNAQIAGQSSFTLPSDEDSQAAARFVTREQALLSMQESNIKGQKDALARLKQISTDSVAAVNDQIESVKARMAMAQDRLATTSGLVERGVMQQSQVRDIEGTIIDMEGSMSQLRATLATQQSTMLTEQSRVDVLVQEYQVGLVTQLAAAEREREDLQTNLANYRQMLELYDPNQEGTASLRYEIIRRGEAGPIDVDATEQTEIFPGDLVRVTQTSIAADLERQRQEAAQTAPSETPAPAPATPPATTTNP